MIKLLQCRVFLVYIDIKVFIKENFILKYRIRSQKNRNRFTDNQKKGNNSFLQNIVEFAL